MNAMNEKDIGALWIRAGKKTDYLTGVITIDGVAHEIVAFPNTVKKSPKQPDWRLYKSRKKDEENF